MVIPITGFIFDSGESDPNHSHQLFITSWDGRPVAHVHPFSGITSYDAGHSHQYSAMTAPAPSGVQHVHGYYAETSIDQGHTHIIRGTTGPSIPLPGGGHYHHFEGYTTVNGMNPHTHMYRGNTGNEVS
ncbi:YmaF family protein [Paenibacillus silviterrae]|uniref:YmaF family protein n=1 Tax=Paenibacillus silviterrae TaxID=3242194 RepID=UPI002542FD13|nr:YmaF family protein [Paenibacillus chinjuensis]